jgi:nitroreductase
MDERLQIIFARRSIREYTGQPVSEADITSLLQAGMAAPSSMNRKPWHLVVVTDKQTLGAIAAAPPYARTLGDAALVIVVCGDPSISDWWLQDCTLATENILIAAAGLGLGAVFLGCHGRVLCIGHPAEEKEPRTQYDPAQIHRNKW